MSVCMCKMMCKTSVLSVILEYANKKQTIENITKHIINMGPKLPYICPAMVLFIYLFICSYFWKVRENPSRRQKRIHVLTLTPKLLRMRLHCCCCGENLLNNTLPYETSTFCAQHECFANFWSHSNGKFIGVWGLPLEVNGLLAKVVF